MVRGIFIPLKFPFAHFPTANLTGEQLFPIIWEAIERVESAGLKALCVIADGASTNRKFFRMHGDGSETVYKTPNIFANEDRHVYFISDPPHLIHSKLLFSLIWIWEHKEVVGNYCMFVAYIHVHVYTHTHTLTLSVL